MDDAETKNHFHLYVILIYIAILVLVFTLWYFIWLRPGYCSFPTGKYNFQRLLHDTMYKPTSITDFCMKYGQIFLQLDPEYWISICGTDIYCYLFCQRQIMSFCFYMLAVNFGVKLYTSLFYESRDWKILDTNVEETELEHNFMLGQQMVMITTFTILLIIKIVKMIDHFGKVSFSYYNKVDTIDLKSLQMRTLHIKGIVPEDTKADILMEKIENYLKDINGKILAMKIIPNYANLVTLETKRRDLTVLHRLFNVYGPSLKRLWIPKRYYDKEKYEAALAELNIRVANRKSNKKNKSKKICFYTVNSLNKKLSDIGQEDLRVSTLRRSRMDSDNIRNEYENFGITARPVTEPLDIIWENMSGYRGVYFFRRVFINIVIIVTLFFFSSPYGIFTLINRYIVDLENYSWAYNISEGFGKFMQGGIPPFMTLVIAVVITNLINTATTYEKNTYHSKYQKSVFRKAAFFLIFNNVIIPGLSFAQKSSVFTATKRLFRDPHMLLRNFYNHDTSGFFVTIIAQLSVLYALVYLLRIRQLFAAFMSPWLQYYRQQYINDVEKWSKRPLEVFEYGYLLAQMIVVFFIIMIFSTTVPLVLIMGIIYFVIRHVVDAINLLIMHKMELDSLGSLIRTMLSAIVMCGILSHVCFLGFLIDVKGYKSIAVLMANTIALIWLLVYLRRPFFSLIRLQRRAEPVQDADSEDIDEWQEAYRHPLIIRQEQERLMGIGTQMDIILDPRKRPKERRSRKVEKKEERLNESEHISQSVIIELADER